MALPALTFIWVSMRSSQLSTVGEGSLGMVKVSWQSLPHDGGWRNGKTPGRSWREWPARRSLSCRKNEFRSRGAVDAGTCGNSLGHFDAVAREMENLVMLNMLIMNAIRTLMLNFRQNLLDLNRGYSG